MRKIAAFLFMLFIPGFLSAQDYVPFKIQAALLVKVLDFDKTLEKNTSSGTVNIGILCSDDRISKEKFKSLLKEILELKAAGVKVKGFTLDCTLVQLKDEKSLAEDLKSKNIGVLFFAVDKKESLSFIIKTSQNLKVLTMASDFVDDIKAGVSVGFAIEDGKPSIYLNLKSAAKEGADFDEKLVKMSKIVN